MTDLTDKVMKIVRKHEPSWYRERKCPAPWRTNGCVCWQSSGRPDVHDDHVDPAAWAAVMNVDLECQAERVGEAVKYGQEWALFECEHGVFAVKAHWLTLFNGLDYRAAHINHESGNRVAVNALVGVDATGKARVYVAEADTYRVNET